MKRSKYKGKPFPRKTESFPGRCPLARVSTVSVRAGTPSLCFATGCLDILGSGKSLGRGFGEGGGGKRQQQTRRPRGGSSGGRGRGAAAPRASRVWNQSRAGSPRPGQQQQRDVTWVVGWIGQETGPHTWETCSADGSNEGKITPLVFLSAV